MASTDAVELNESSILDFSRNAAIAPLIVGDEADLRQRMFALADPDVQKPWEFYATAFSSQLRGADDWSNIHLSVTHNYLDWSHPDYGKYYFLRFADQLPLWQGRYAPGVQTFQEAYRFLVVSYAIEYAADPALQASAREKAFILQIAIQDMYDGDQQITFKWAEFDQYQKKYLPEHRWKSYDEWYAAGWSKKMVVLKNRVTIATAEYQSVMNSMGLGNALIAEAIANSGNDAYFSRAKAPDGTEFIYPSYNTSHSFPDFIDGTKENLRQNPEHVGFRFGFSHSSGWYSESNTSFGANGTFSLGGGFALNVGGQWEERRIDTTSQNFAVDVTFAGFQEFAITPGGWYSPLVLQLIKEGPWVEKSFVRRWIDQGKDVWGSRGLLPLQQLSAYVGIQPKFRISLATHEYHYYRQAYSAGAGVSFFGMRLGGGGGGSEHIEISFHDDVSTFEVSDRSGKAMLVGVRSMAMPPAGA